MPTKRPKFTVEKPRMPRNPLALSDTPQTVVDITAVVPEHERKAPPSRRKRMSSRGVCDCCHRPLTGHKQCFLCGILVGDGHAIEPNPIYIKQERIGGKFYGPVWVCRCHNVASIYETAKAAEMDMKKEAAWSKINLDSSGKAAPVYSMNEQPQGTLSADQAEGLCTLKAARIRVLIKKKFNLEPVAYLINHQGQSIRLYDQHTLTLALIPYIKIDCPLVKALKTAPFGCWDEGRVVASA